MKIAPSLFAKQLLKLSLAAVALLACAQSGLAADTVLVWDPATSGTGSDGNGTWDTTTSEWASTGLGFDFPWPNAVTDEASIGSGTAGTYTITLGANIITNAIQFNAGSTYTIAGDAGGLYSLTFGGTTPTITENAAGSTISAPIAGTTAITVNGTGTLTLSGANTFAVAAPSTSTSVASPSLVLGGTAKLNLGTSTTLQNEVVNVGSVNNSLLFSAGLGTAKVAGLTGSGNITLADQAVTPAAVTLILGNEGDAATLGLTFNSAAGPNATGTYSGVLSGAGGLTKAGPYVSSSGVTSNGVSNIGVNPFAFTTGAYVAGTEVLSGNNTYTGATLVSAGTLQLAGTGTGTTGEISGTSGLTVSGSGIFIDGDSTAANNNSIANRVNASAGLVLGGTGGGGTFELAQGTVADSQSLASLTVSTGGNFITAVNAGSSTLTFTGAGSSVYTDNAHSTVNIGSISGVAISGFTPSFTNAPTTSVAGTGSNAILEGATLNGNDFIADQAGTLTHAAYSTATAASTEAGLNVQVTGNTTLASGATPNSIAFNTALTGTGPTLTLAGTNIIASGDILVGALDTASANTIAGGTITSGTQDLQLFDYDLLGGNSQSGTSSQNSRAGATASGLTISSVIANNTNGAVAVDVSGPAITYLSGVNTYTGGTYLDGGRLYINSDASLGSTTTEAGIVAENGYNSISAAAAITTSRAITINAGATLLLSDGNSANYSITDSGALSGAGALEIGFVSDGSLVVLTGNNSNFTGNYFINDYLRAQEGTGLSANANTVFDGRSDNNLGLLEMNGTFTGALGTGAGQVQWQDSQGYGSGGFAQNGTGTLTVNLGGSGAALTFGQAGFVANGLDSLVLQDSRSTNTVTLQNNLVLALTGNTITTENKIGVAGGNSSADAAILSGVISGSGTLNKTGAGFLTLSNANNSYTGGNNFNNEDGAGGTVSVSSLANGGSNSGLGASSNAATNLVISGQTLQYTGGTASTDRLFQIGENTTFAAGTAGYNTETATIDASGTGALTFSNTGAILFNGGTAAAAGSVVTSNATLTLTGTNTGANIFDPLLQDVDTQLGGSYTTSLTKSGIGTWILTNNNTFTGPTSVTAGTLVFGNNGITGVGATGSETTASVAVSSGATIGFDQANGTTYSGAITDSGTVNGQETAGITNTLSGTISGTGVFTQTGAGSTLLTGTGNTYSGAGGTAVSAGYLGADNTAGTATGAGPVVVSSTGTLTGGQVSTAFEKPGVVVPTLSVYTPSSTAGSVGATTVGVAAGGGVAGSSGTISPGTSSTGLGSIATITMSSLTLNSGSQVDLEFGATSNDFIGVTGALTITGPVSFNLYSLSGSTDSAFATAGVYDIMSYNSAQGSPTASLASSDFSVANGVAGYTYTFVNDPTADVVQLDVAPTPEPATWALLLGGLGVLVAIRRHRAKLS